MHTNSILPSLIPVCWRYRSTPSPPSWLSRHKDATGDRIMHFSWGSECKCAHCSSSVWAMFCSVNTYSFLWFDCLFLERQTSLVNNHVSSWNIFYSNDQMSSYNFHLGFSFVALFLFRVCSLLLHILYNQRVSMHFLFYSQFIQCRFFKYIWIWWSFLVNDATVKWTTLYFSSTVYASQKQKALNIIKLIFPAAWTLYT